jgi:hypothetical protein
MHTSSHAFRKSAFASTALILPLLFLELRNLQNFNGFPFMLFALLWSLPFAFLVILAWLFRKGPTIERPRAVVVLGVASLVLVAFFWTGMLIDQAPCFMGVPNCD